MDLTAQIKKLESASNSLDPDSNARNEIREIICRYSETFLESLSDRPVFKRTSDEGRGLDESPIAEDGEDIVTLMDLFERHVVDPGLNPASPGHFGYIPGSGLYHAALGDFLAAVTNRYSGIYAASPGAVRMEQMVIRWLTKEMGYPETAAGDLTSGGSIANLSAVVTARDAFEIKAKDYHRLVVYVTAHTHHCIGKAIRTAGLGECLIRVIPVDACYRMKPGDLEDRIARDRKENRIPWLIVASAGTTDTGSVDPLEALAAIAGDNRLWFHVDGAYGASFMLCERGRNILKGIERSDSLVVDPHKGLFIPFGTGVILVKNGRNLHRSFDYQANYMQDEKTLVAVDSLSPAELSPEMTRHYRGMRLWLPLKLSGVGPFRAALEEKLLLARYFYEKVRQIEGIETGPEPDLSIVIFRYVPEASDADFFNQKLIEKIMNDGRVFMSSTLIEQKFMLRLAVLSFRTHLEKVDQAITIIRSAIEEIKRELSSID